VSAEKKPQPIVILIRESLLLSWGRDLVTFGWLLGGLWLNHNHLGGHWMVTLTLCIGLFAFGMSSVRSKAQTVEEAIKSLEAMRKPTPNPPEENHG
jgi:hypothetical protein